MLFCTSHWCDMQQPIQGRHPQRPADKKQTHVRRSADTGADLYSTRSVSHLETAKSLIRRVVARYCRILRLWRNEGTPIPARYRAKAQDWTFCQDWIRLSTGTGTTLVKYCLAAWLNIVCVCFFFCRTDQSPTFFFSTGCGCLAADSLISYCLTEKQHGGPSFALPWVWAAYLQ